MFQTLIRRTVRWRALPSAGQGEGLGHVDIASGANGIEARGASIGAVNDRPFAAVFRLLCDPDWRTRFFTVRTSDGRKLELRSERPGQWTDASGVALRELDGCIDIDLQASPLTNTLPIRRLALTAEMGPVELSMAYVPFDSFEPYAHRERYTCLEDGRRYLYENADGSFSAELTLDDDGLVADYPGLFERVEFGSCRGLT